MREHSELVVLVTGASRGIGRGVAMSMGEQGATVYVTGRSIPGSSTENLPQTVQETAELVTSRGGKGHAIVCDHTNDSEVQRVFETIEKEQGRLDVLVNNVWGGYEGYDFAHFQDPFWNQPLSRWDEMFTAGLRAHLTASRRAAPTMIRQRNGLIISTVAWDRDMYLGNLFYDVAKHATVRMVRGMARELKPHNVCVLAIAPGFARTERVMSAISKDKNFPMEITESPQYAGRAVAALVGDSKVFAKSGNVYRVGDLAQEYGFKDVDGRQVPPFNLPESSSF